MAPPSWCVCYISPHIRRQALWQVGGWDANNVTEDAELGFRLHKFGWDIGYIRPSTSEEAVSRFPIWISQRSRWMKEFMQTFHTYFHPLLGSTRHMDKNMDMDPSHSQDRKRLISRLLSLWGTIGMSLLSGSTHLPTLVISIFILCFGALAEIPKSVIIFFIGAGIYCYGTGLIMALCTIKRTGHLYLWRAILSMPLYWICLFLPTLIALYEFYKAPNYWRKTPHGTDMKWNRYEYE